MDGWMGNAKVVRFMHAKGGQGVRVPSFFHFMGKKTARCEVEQWVCSDITAHNKT